MSTYIDNYRTRVQRSGTTLKEKAINEGRRNYDKYLQESPTHHRVQASRPQEVTVEENSDWIDVAINDIALNDKRNLDEKILTVRYDENIDVGCYIYWEDNYWLLAFREFNSFQTHRTYTLRKCNQIFRYRYEGIVYEMPICATNLTLYSDGLADGKYVSRQDAKRNIWIGDNPISRAIVPNTRILLTHKTAFRVTHIDDFSVNGVVNLLVLQTVLEPEDDIINNIAWNGDISTEVVTPIGEIKGEDIIYLGATKEFTIEGYSNIDWEIALDGTVEYAKIISESDTNCRIAVSTSSKYVGSSIYLSVYDKATDELITVKKITIKGYF